MTPDLHSRLLGDMTVCKETLIKYSSPEMAALKAGGASIIQYLIQIG